MKIVVFGMNGQLGSDVVAALSSQNVVSTTGARTEITDPDAVLALIKHNAPDWVINCAAMTHVDRCETEAAQAFAVNGIGARNVARAAAAAGAPLIHISTDYVFDGNKASPYVETDGPRPLNVYGMSKLAGEWFVADDCPHHYVLRSSGLYGTHECRGKGTNFVETMLRLGGERKSLKIVEDEVLTPTFCQDLAALVVDVIEKRPAFGVYHATNEGSCSWFQFAAEIFKQTGMDVHVAGISSRDWGAPARRPANSVLDNRALREIGMNRFDDWKDALARYLAARQT